MNYLTKLKNLQAAEDIALYRWTAGRGRIGNDYILLSNLRFNVLECNGGKVHLSIYAPVLVVDLNRPKIVFQDHDVLTVTSGSRQGVNIKGGFIRPGEDAIEASYVGRYEITEESPQWIQKRVLSLGSSPYYPVDKILMPELYRMTREPKKLRPIWNSRMLSLIGGSKNDTVEDLREKFQRKLNLFGTFIDSGYVIPYDYIATGGCVVCSSRGITTKTGSPVHGIPLSVFRQEAVERNFIGSETNDIPRFAE